MGIEGAKEALKWSRGLRDPTGELKKAEES